MFCFYMNSVNYFILGYSIVKIGYTFASNTIMIYVKGFSDRPIKAVGISKTFASLIGNIYCMILDRYVGY